MPQDSTRQASDALSSAKVRTSLGLVTYCFDVAKRARAEIPELPNFSDPLTFIEQSVLVGANAVQIGFGVLAANDVRKIRAFAEEKGIHLESTLGLPRAETEMTKFEVELRTLRELGVQIARTVILPGRRYEQFKTLEEFRTAVEAGGKALRQVEPIARKHGVRLAVENHKDQRVDERLKLLENFSSEWIRACLDVGNNLALLEDPVEVARAFAPWTATVHFKDQGIRAYDDGFLLADLAAGTGCIDLKQVTVAIREKQPGVRFHLELITARNFLDAVKSRRSPIADLESGHQVATVCHLANISLRTGRKIDWDAQREQIVDDREANRMLERPYRAPWDKELKALLAT